MKAYILAFILTFSFTSGAYALSVKDFKVFSSTFRFVNSLPKKNNYKMVFIYDPGEENSKQAAIKAYQLVKKNKAFRKITIEPILKSFSSLSRTKAELAYIAPGVDYDAPELDWLQTRGVLSFSDDIECVQTKICVLSITTKPNVKIYLSRTAAARGQIEFKQVLKLMVKELQ